MTSKFVEIKTETRVIETKTIIPVEDGLGPFSSYLSVMPNPSGRNLGLVFGALWADRCACSLNKKGLAELIDILKDIHDCMKD